MIFTLLNLKKKIIAETAMFKLVMPKENIDAGKKALMNFFLLIKYE